MSKPKTKARRAAPKKQRSAPKARKPKAKAKRARAVSQATVIPQAATQGEQAGNAQRGARRPAPAAGGPGTANEPAPAPAPAESPQELRQKVEALKRGAEDVAPVPASKEEVARLKRMGLREYPVKGTSLMLIGLIDPAKAPSTVEQRVEMARRLNEVGPKLPRYILHLMDEKRPEVSTKAIIEVSQHVQNGEEMAKKAAAEKKQQAAGAKPAKPTKQGKTDKPAKQGNGGKKAGGGIGSLVESLLLAKKSPDDILKEVKKKFPDAKTSHASIAWYRNKLRQEGSLPKD